MRKSVTLSLQENIDKMRYKKKFAISLSNPSFNPKELKKINIKDFNIQGNLSGHSKLISLAEQSGMFYDQKERTKINQWLMAQMGYVGPMLGQHHQFHHYNPGKSEFGEQRYFKIAKQIYKDLDERLSEVKFLAGENYTIADIATFPWIARHEWHDIGLKKFINLKRWYEEIAKRDAVQKGYDLLKNGELIPNP